MIMKCVGCKRQFEEGDINAFDRCPKCEGRYKAYEHIANLIDSGHYDTLDQLREIAQTEMLNLTV
jgi:hypothetical protein